MNSACLRFFLVWFFLILSVAGFSQTYTPQQGRAAWKELKKKPVTEDSFRETCDLIQNIGKTNLDISYEILAEYLSTIQKTGGQAKSAHYPHELGQSKRIAAFF